MKCNLLFALSHGAEAIILDEPASVLGPFSRNGLLELFGQIRRAGVATFLSTHIVSDIEKCASDAPGFRVSSARRETSPT